MRTAIPAARAAAEVVEELDGELATVRATLNANIAASPFGALVSVIRARTEAAYAFRTALASAGGDGNEERVLAALGDEATAARRAVGMLHGGHPAALPPAPAEPAEYDWLIDALLNLDTLLANVRDLNIQLARR